MSRGNKIFLILFLFLFSQQAQAEERGINLNEIQPSFDLDDQPSEEKSNDSNFKFQASKKQDMSSSESFSKINLVILDKITSKQENFSSSRSIDGSNHCILRVDRECVVQIQ